jgi:hypothetical protein
MGIKVVDFYFELLKITKTYNFRASYEGILEILEFNNQIKS